MNLNILNESEVAQPQEFLEKWVTAIEKALTKKKLWPAANVDKDLILVFLDAGPAKKLNWQFRGKDYPTDVLSFEGTEEASVGELVMCPQVLQKQAEENKHDYKFELGYMVLHGILHLLGYDHEKSEDEAKRMFDLQDALFAALKKSVK